MNARFLIYAFVVSALCTSCSWSKLLSAPSNSAGGGSWRSTTGGGGGSWGGGAGGGGHK